MSATDTSDTPAAFTDLQQQLDLQPLAADSTVYSIECNRTYSPLQLKIGGLNYALPKQTLTSSISVPGSGTPRCMFLVMPNTGVNQWYLGDAFFNYYCVIHDLGGSRMGLAQHKVYY